MAVEDEEEFLLRSLDYIVEPNSALSEYLTHRNILFVMLCLYLFFRFCLSVYSARNADMLLLQM